MILNKVDLVASDDSGVVLEDLEKDIHNINSLANIIHSVHCQVDLSMILNRRAYDATVSSFIAVQLHSSPCVVAFLFVVKVEKLSICLFVISACHSLGSTIEREPKSIYQ